MNKNVELVIVGAGPAGIEAAITASEFGIEVSLVDLAPRPGGQYFQQPPEAFQEDAYVGSKPRERQFLQRLSSSKIELRSNTLVWGIFEGSKPGSWCLKLHGPLAPAQLNARAVILAPGAYDCAIPFPGWDLPGVITAGAALRMVKNQRVLPGKRVLLSGTGPLQMQTAAYLLQAGAEVVTVCENARSLLLRGVPHLPSVWGQWEKLKEGFDFLKVLVQARVPYRMGWAVTAAHGKDRVTQARIQKIDNTGFPISQPEIIEDIDVVVLGYGLTPSTELFRQLGCEMEFSRLGGGFVPQRNQRMQTSCAGIYGVGDGARIGGVETAIIEGRIAGYASAAQLGHLSKEAADKLISRQKPALCRQMRFAKTLAKLFPVPAGMFSFADQDTVICRCEQVTLGEVKRAISFGAQTVTDVKNIARMGMGNCQSRTCGTIVAHILAAETGKTREDVHCLNIRPPIHPLPLIVIEEFDNGSVKGVERQ